uniref:U2266a n=1 Tax=Mycobacterium leprae TaxID=1769 RepID=Q50019_MYCLR|nr:u2266a [Mycobacterium leprae]
MGVPVSHQYNNR